MGTVDISLPPPCSEVECPPKRLTSKCSTSKTKTPRTSSSGSPTTSSPLSVISHPRVSRCPSPSLVTPLPSKRCSRESPSSSLLCSEERLSSIGTPVKVWMRWNSLKLNPTLTISSLSTNNTKMPPPKRKVSTTRKRKMKRLDPALRCSRSLYLSFFIH